MNELNKYFITKKPNIFFTGYGFEERSIRLLELIKNRVSFEYSFTIGFPSSFLGSTNLWKSHKAFIDDNLSNVTNHFETINISIKQPVQVCQNLRERIDKLDIDLKNFCILIDITSFPKSTLFMLLKELIELGASGYLFYIEPMEYELPISIGVSDIRLLPFFGDDYDTKKRKLLIEILGFEGIRSYAIWERFDPHRTIALVGKPFSSNPHYNVISENENKLLLSRPHVEKREISFTDLSDAKNTLNSIYEEVGNKYNIIVSSLGTKLSAISLFYFANHHKNVFVAFSRPNQHTEHYSSGSKTLFTVFFDKNFAIIKNSLEIN
jgi:hypothetical protein